MRNFINFLWIAKTRLRNKEKWRKWEGVFLVSTKEKQFPFTIVYDFLWFVFRLKDVDGLGSWWRWRWRWRGFNHVNPRGVWLWFSQPHLNLFALMINYKIPLTFRRGMRIFCFHLSQLKDRRISRLIVLHSIRILFCVTRTRDCFVLSQYEFFEGGSRRVADSAK